MAKRLAKRPELLDSIVPDFAPNCRRLTPGPGYLEALTEENVDFVSTPIKRFTSHGIETTDGKIREVDAVICCTGANIDFAPPFSIISRGVDLKSAWKPNGEFGFPYNYLGVGTPGFPNLLYVQGPNAVGPSGTVPQSVETQVTYLSKILRKISSQGIKSMVPSKEATDDFVEYCDAFFETTVFSDECSSWANGGRPGARVHGHWPGSASHLTHIRKEPRWEDWEYEYVTQRNRFGYFGNGRSSREVAKGVDLVDYLRKPEDIDLRSIHEGGYGS